MTRSPQAAIEQAASAISNAEAVLVATGAGMGVDSGLPDFRGNAGFWRAYPPLERLGISFSQMANPAWFSRDPQLAWGFYGHRLNLYRSTRPHAGFGLLRRWSARSRHGGFVFTSNVDGQHQQAGFDRDRIAECHGSIHHLQCTDCAQSPRIWDAAEARVKVDVDPESFRAEPPLPACPHCGSLARPNILMFGDWDFVPTRTNEQEQRFERWLGGVRSSRLVVIEIGAGTAVPTVRMTAERITRLLDGRLIRINPREPEVPDGQIGMAAPALQTLRQIDELLETD